MRKRRPYPRPEDRARWVAGFEDAFVDRARARLGEAFTPDDEHLARWEGQCMAERIWDIRHPEAADA